LLITGINNICLINWTLLAMSFLWLAKVCQDWTLQSRLASFVNQFKGVISDQPSIQWALFTHAFVRSKSIGWVLSMMIVWWMISLNSILQQQCNDLASQCRMLLVAVQESSADMEGTKVSVIYYSVGCFLTLEPQGNRVCRWSGGISISVKLSRPFILTRVLALSRIYDVGWKSGQPTAASKVCSISTKLRTVLTPFTKILTDVLSNLMFVYFFVIRKYPPSINQTIGQSYYGAQ
jgi:hypothetical protein